MPEDFMCRCKCLKKSSSPCDARIQIHRFGDHLELEFYEANVKAVRQRGATYEDTRKAYVVLDVEDARDIVKYLVEWLAEWALIAVNDPPHKPIGG